MKRGSKKVSGGRRGPDVMKKRVGVALIILVIALVGFSVWFFIGYSKPCGDSACYSNAIKSCKHVSWVKEDAQASWVYTIKGNTEGDNCEVEVRLREMKQGTIDSEKLEGKDMLCTVLKSDTQFPEKDISRCSGELKEELQDLIIQRMHNYLLENVGEIQQEFVGF